MEARDNLIKILIPAVGGQGGGVLTEWLVQAFLIEGYEVQGVGLPGLSQRGGSTIYYLESYNKKASGQRKLVFSQYPLPSDIDIILSQEFLELGRVLEQGYGSEKTTIISSTHRIYSTLEKMPISGGICSEENLRRLAETFSSRFIGFNGMDLAKENGMDDLAINAILLGSLGASGALNIAEASYLKAIAQVGVATENNIKAFRIGWEHVRSKRYAFSLIKSGYNWDEFKKERADRLTHNKREDYLYLLEKVEEGYPNLLREILAESIFRLIDYQDTWYANQYLELLNKIYILDKDSNNDHFKITETFAKNLALWMSYEDGIRVAELKIHPERFKRIKKEMQLTEEQVFHVIDYLNPDAEEIYGLLPNLLISPFAKFIESSLFKKIWPKSKRITVPQTPVSSSFFGGLRLWLLTKLKTFRPYSYRYKKEHSLIKKYSSFVEKYMQLDYGLGTLIAKSGQLIKGYGNVRRRTVDSFNRFLDNIIIPLAELENETGDGFKLTLEYGEVSFKLISTSTDGIEKAEKLVKEVLKKKAA